MKIKKMKIYNTIQNSGTLFSGPKLENKKNGELIKTQNNNYHE